MKVVRQYLFIGLVLFLPANQLLAADEAIMQRLDRIERLLQSQGLLDMLQQIESLQTELSNLQGEIEYQNHTLDQLTRRQRDLYTDIDQRLQRLERGIAGVDSGAAAGGDINLVEFDDNSSPPLQTIEPVEDALASSVDSAQPDESLVVEVVENNTATAAEQAITVEAVEQQVSTLPASSPTGETTTQQGLNEVMNPPVELDPVQVRAQYQAAFKLLKRSQYDQAIKAFTDFLVTSPGSEYSDNAQYWLGEAYYVTRQFEQALVEYNKLLSNYPESKKLTHSLLKIGFCYYEMGAMEQAVNRLQYLKQNYPDTTASRLADERLKKIARENVPSTQEADTAS